MAWKKRAYATIRKVSFVLCVMYGIGAIIWYSFFDRADHDLGTYYVYTSGKGNVIKETPVFSRGRDCDLVLNSDSSKYDFTLDTISVSVFLPVQLINYECDSLVAVIRFPNEKFDPTRNSSNAFNPRFTEGVVSFKNLFKHPPDSTRVAMNTTTKY